MACHTHHSFLTRLGAAFRPRHRNYSKNALNWSWKKHIVHYYLLVVVYLCLIVHVAIVARMKIRKMN
jgi:hypothetical protein